MLSHRAILSNCAGCFDLLRPLNLGAEEIYLSFLPLSHTFERTCGYYLTIMCGATVSYARSVQTLGDDLQTIKPTMLISVPTGVKVFNWIATMWKGSMTFETPMLFAVGFIFVFTMGGFTGLICAMAPIDTQIQDTYYVVAHFHYVLVAGSLFAMFAGYYYWSPKWTGVMYNETRGKIHFWMTLISFNVTFFPMHFLGLAGMPRRYADYPMQFTDFNQIASIGAFGFGLMQVYFFLFVVVPMMRGKGEKAPQKPWEAAEGLEWEVPSPAPFHTFEEPPKLDASATRIVA